LIFTRGRCGCTQRRAASVERMNEYSTNRPRVIRFLEIFGSFCGVFLADFRGCFLDGFQGVFRGVFLQFILKG